MLREAKQDQPWCDECNCSGEVEVHIYVTADGKYVETFDGEVFVQCPACLMNAADWEDERGNWEDA